MNVRNAFVRSMRRRPRRVRTYCVHRGGQDDETMKVLSTTTTRNEEKPTWTEIPEENIRTFSIVAHVDHGKSTLADRLLERTGNVSSSDVKGGQVLDTLQVERERGITVKAQTASMIYDAENGERYLLQLIDTPGHVDFQYEVSRALMACEGALLLVDSSQGVQAQTLATHRAAKEAGLEIVPVLTKIDLPHSDPDRCLDQIIGLCDVRADILDDLLMTSAKTGDGIDDVLEAIVKYIPPPPPTTSKTDSRRALRALMVDSWYDQYQGVVMLLQVLEGRLEEGQNVRLLNAQKDIQVTEIGVLTPTPKRLQSVSVPSGRVAYVVSNGLREPRDARAGDTICDSVFFSKQPDAVVPLPGFEPAVPMVFASVYPVDDTDFDVLNSSISRLLLTDTSVSLEKESNVALGLGFRCGFLGLLHMDVFTQRLQQEHRCDVIITAPSVPYRANVRETSASSETTQVTVESASELPIGREVESYEQPMVQVTVVAPSDCLGDLMNLLQGRDGTQDDLSFLTSTDQVVLKYTMPWREVVMDLYDEVKSLSSGYASLEYADVGYQKASLRRVDILINGERVDVLSLVAPPSKAQSEGRKVCLRLKKVIPRQQFEINLQAAVGNKILAKERVPPFRKNVLVKSGKTVGGGDKTRKEKLLKKQREGKKRMKTVGKVTLSQDAFLAVVKR